MSGLELVLASIILAAIAATTFSVLANTPVEKPVRVRAKTTTTTKMKTGDTAWY